MGELPLVDVAVLEHDHDSGAWLPAIVYEEELAAVTSEQSQAWGLQIEATLEALLCLAPDVGFAYAAS
jgi:hypothetical protein